MKEDQPVDGFSYQSQLNTSNNSAEMQMLLLIRVGQGVGAPGQSHVEDGQGHNREDCPLLGKQGTEILR